jgi:DnaJ-domain-containing protein 1
MFRKDGDDVADAAAAEVEAALTSPKTVANVAKAPAVTDVDGALRVLELSGSPHLDEVRARYRQLAQRYHPKTVGGRPDEVAAAHVVMESFTEALELLEEHLLPLPPA